MNDSFIHVFIF